MNETNDETNENDLPSTANNLHEEANTSERRSESVLNSEGLTVKMPTSLSSFSVLSLNSTDSNDAIITHHINLQV